MKSTLSNLLIPSPIQKVEHPLLKEEHIQLFVKREDLIHTLVSGNKWRKLKYNLQHAKANRLSKIVTFGGAFSNHIHAIAAACKAFELNVTGFIRGEYDPDNPTLQFAKDAGMDLKFIDRSSYREKEKSTIVNTFLKAEKNYLLVPEGGTNDLAYEGLRELAEEINNTPYDIIMVSAGTGGTASGILNHLSPNKELWVFSSLKSEYLYEEILKKVPISKKKQLKFIPHYHFGGYGKIPEQLVNFINDFYSKTNLQIDPIYNGKLVKGFFDLLQTKKLDKSKSYLWVHTGGLQGIEAYNYMASKKEKPQIIT